ncbi:PhoX family protein [Rhodobium gokarnense]|uniref:Secreted PhoX family phosphatase n=1 Tax=Rhodobium gokarnense TaxID=364296 RepID=A0ABT3H681_9HYPH|nr:PhoX family protein [Rhodobium gokarnense]MCW2305884.1 secreted PhoX family phosphatase [Rhodobium gokarnense]
MTIRSLLLCTTVLTGLSTAAFAAEMSFSPVKFPETDTEKRAAVASEAVTVDGTEHKIGYHVLMRSGDMDVGILTDKDGNPVKNEDGSIHVSVDADFTSLLPVGGKLFSVSHFESRPGAMYVSELKQGEDGLLTVVSTKPVDFSAFGGLWVPCAGSVTPWGTHLGSEEYPADARAIEDAKTIEDIDDYNKPMVRYFGLNLSDMTVDDFRAAYNPYRYGFVTEVTVAEDGTATPQKHFATGRVAVELGYVMPDEKTVYISDDGTNVGLFRFVADTAGDLSAGTLYAAKWTQTSDEGAGAADLSWIDLGHADDASVQKLIEAGTKFSDIFEVGEMAEDGTCGEGFMGSNAEGAAECLKVKDGMELAASRLETRRYASMMGATTEFRKMEGITFDPATSKLYLAISSVERGMEDNAKNGKATDKYDKGGRNDIKVGSNKCGAVYELDIDGDMVASTIRSVVEGKETSYEDGSPYAGNSCDVDAIANPDNLTFVKGTRTLIIGEDTGSGHQNDAIWAYNMDSKELTRIMTTPYGSETTSPYWYGDINGHGYLIAVIQHPYGESDQDKLSDAADARAYIGYVGPFPAIAEK